MADKIEDIYRQVLPKGVRLLPTILPSQQEEEQPSPFQIEDGTGELGEVQRNAYGSAVIYPFTFIENEGRESEVRWTLPNSPLVRVEGMKKIVRTSVAGLSSGSVKEVTSVEDWRVIIRGIAMQIDGAQSIVRKRGYPIEMLKWMRKLFSINRSLKVENEVMEAFGISRLVIQRFNVPATPGMQSAFYYELDCISDSEEEIVIINRR